MLCGKLPPLRLAIGVAYLVITLVSFSGTQAANPDESKAETALRLQIIERLQRLERTLKTEARKGETLEAPVKSIEDTASLISRIQTFGRSGGQIASALARSYTIPGPAPAILPSGSPASVPAYFANGNIDFLKGNALSFIASRRQEFENYADHVSTLSESAKTEPLPQLIEKLQVAYIPKSIQEMIDNTSVVVFGGESSGKRFGNNGASGDGLLGFTVGPSSSPTTDFPAVGELLYDDAASGALGICTATLVRPDIVVTAAHCICNDPGLNRGARLPNYSRCSIGRYSRDGATHDVSSGAGYSVFFQHAGNIPVQSGGVSIHENYSFPSSDIALLRLARSVKGIRPAKINKYSRLPEGSNATIVGFGWHNTIDPQGRPDISQSLVKHVGIKVSASTQTGSCPETLRNRSMICWNYSATARDTLTGSTCHGDSGGPLFAILDEKPVLAGITSGGRTCRPGDKPFDTEVFDYHTWIESKINAIGPPPTNTTVNNELLALKNSANRFTFSSPYKMFTRRVDSWSKKFSVSANHNSLRFGLNATFSGGAIRLIVKDQASGASLCDVTTDHVAHVCEISAIANRRLTFEVSGAPMQRYQIVATGF